MAKVSDDLKVTRLQNLARNGVKVIPALRRAGASERIIEAVKAILLVKDSFDLRSMETLRMAAMGYDLLAENLPDLQ